MKKTIRSLLLAVVASAMLLPVSGSQNEPIRARGAIQMRDLLPSESSAVISTPAPSSTAAATSSQAATTAVATSSSTAAAAAATTTTPSATAATTAATSAAGTTHTSADAQPTSTSPTQLAVQTSAVATTDAAGQVVTSFIAYTPTPSATPSQTDGSSNNNSSSSDDDNSGLSTGSIAGLSVSGGIAAIAIILFFVWKFTRKRFSDFDDSTSPYVNVSCGLM